MALAPLPHVAKRRRTSAGIAHEHGPGPDHAAWSTLYQEMLRQSICLFGSEVLNIELAPHFLDWEERIQQESRIALLAARDHGKSCFFSYTYPIWRAWSEPGCAVYIFSKTLEQAMEHLDILMFGNDTLSGISGHPQLGYLVPQHSRAGSRVRLKRTDLRFTNGSRIRAVGYGKAIRGVHPKYIVLDDVLNDDDLWSELQRRKHIEYYKSAIANLPPRDGQICAVGTPYHISDLYYGFFRGSKAYTFKSYPGIIKEKGKDRALFPYRWPLKSLYAKRDEIGPVAFAREILCQPITDDMAIFPVRLFERCYDKTLTLQPSKDVCRTLQIYFGVDIARSASVGADFFVIFVVGIDNLGNRIVLDIIREKGLDFKNQLAKISMAALRYEPALIHIESNAMQQVWTDEIIRTTDLPVRPFITTAQNKYPLDKGVPGLRIIIENQKLVIPRGDAYSVEITDQWITECSHFGFFDGKLQSAGDHDDTVMSWWLAEEAAKAGGFSFSFGDDDVAEDGLPDLEGSTGSPEWEKELLGSDEEMQGLLDSL